jgi:enamine deaminase RidA (YjgF/YER057c/UK114 family)
MSASREDALRRIAAEVGFDLDAEIKVGGNYVPFIVSGNWIHVSGQISRVDASVVLEGRAGAGVSLAQAQRAGEGLRRSARSRFCARPPAAWSASRRSRT